MFGIIVLHESVNNAIKPVLYERQKAGVENSHIKLSIHYTSKDADVSSTRCTDFCPYMHLRWMFGTGLVLQFLSLLPVVPFPVCFKLDRGLITEYDILKMIISML